MLRKVCCGVASILVFVSFDDGRFDENTDRWMIGLIKDHQ